MSRFLVDTSVTQRLPRSTAVQTAVTDLLDDEHELCICSIALDEFASSARSPGDHAEAVRRLRSSFLHLPFDPAIELSTDDAFGFWHARGVGGGPSTTADGGLRAPAHLVSRRARMYWTVRALPGWLVIAVLETVVLIATHAPAAAVIPIVAVTVVLGLGHLIVMPQWRYRVHRWEITETAAYTQTGWFTQERRIAPLARVQTVDTRRGPVEQLFGLSNVTVTTASAKGPLVVHALDQDVAEQIVRWLTRRTQVGDGT